MLFLSLLLEVVHRFTITYRLFSTSPQCPSSYPHSSSEDIPFSLPSLQLLVAMCSLTEWLLIHGKSTSRKSTMLSRWTLWSLKVAFSSWMFWWRWPRRAQVPSLTMLAQWSILDPRRQPDSHFHCPSYYLQHSYVRSGSHLLLPNMNVGELVFTLQYHVTNEMLNKL